MHAEQGARLLARGEERVPVAGVDPRQVEIAGQLAERHGPDAARRVATNLRRRQLGVPEWHETQWKQAAAALAAPLVDHPVVVGAHAELGELAVLAPEEDLARESRVVRVTELGLDVVEVHVGQAFGHLPAPRPHVVERDGGQGDVFGVETGRRHVALHRGPCVLVVPPGNPGPFGTGRFDVSRTDQLDLARRVVLDAGPDIAKTGREAVGPHAGGLHDVCVEVDDGRNTRHLLRRHTYLGP